MRSILIRTLALFAVVSQALLLSGCTFKDQAAVYKTDLEVWGVFDDSDIYQQLFGELQRVNPFLGDVKYRKLPVDTYKQDLLDALATGQGPDIFMVRNSWIPQFADKIVPAPDYLIDARSFRETFVDVAVQDFMGQDGKVYAMPLSVDSLALYYNKDLMNAAGITEPPRTWEDVAEAARLLTRVNQFGEIVQSGIAMGTPDPNINRAPDLLSLLFLQRGTDIVNTQLYQADFNSRAATEAASFYTTFANPLSPYYSWNPTLHYSLDSFYEGTAAMMVNYSYHYQTIRRKNAKLNIGIAPLPQWKEGGRTVNYPNYWAFAVSKNKIPPVANPSQPKAGLLTDPAQFQQARIHEAWQMLKFFGYPIKGSITLRNGITGGTKEVPMEKDLTIMYLERLQKPAARRDIIEMQKTSPVLGPFADGNLIAKNWYQRDAEATEGIFNDMIRAINRGDMTVEEALRVAQNRLNVTMQAR